VKNIKNSRGPLHHCKAVLGMCDHIPPWYIGEIDNYVTVLRIKFVMSRSKHIKDKTLLEDTSSILLYHGEFVVGCDLETPHIACCWYISHIFVKVVIIYIAI
jgi:hypothetical protein